MSEDNLRLEYQLARTALNIDGTLTVDTDASGERVAVRTSEVTLGVEADYDVPEQTLDLDAKWWEKREFGIELAADGRLAGASHGSEGLGGQIIGEAVSIVTTIGKLLKGLGIDRGADVLLAPVPIEDDFKADKPALYARRKECAAAIDALQARLLQLAKATAEESGTPESEPIKTVQLALAAARSEAALIETQFEAWRATKYPTWKSTRSYRIGTDQLLQRHAAAPTLELADGELKGDVALAAAALGTVVVRLDPDKDTHTAADPGTDELQYRIPKRITLAVYEVEDVEVPENATNAPPLTFKLRSVVQAWVVDSMSRHEVVPLASEFFKQHGTTVAFGEAGTLAKLTNKQASGVGAALAGIPGQVVGGLDTAAKISAHFPAAPDPELKALKDKVERKELEAKLVEANRKIAGTPATPAS